jgi:excisionase family DNA binding protein
MSRTPNWSGYILPDPAVDCIIDAMPETTYSTREAARELNVSVNRVLDLIEEGRLPGAYRVGRVWKIPVEAVANFERLPHRGKKKRRRTR